MCPHQCRHLKTYLQEKKKTPTPAKIITGKEEPIPTTSPTINEKEEPLVARDILKEIESPRETESVPSVGIYSAKESEHEINTPLKQDEQKMKSAFENKLEHFYQTPQKQKDAEVDTHKKTASPPPNLPKANGKASNAPNAIQEKPLKHDPYKESVE